MQTEFLPESRFPAPEDALPIREAKREPCCPDPSCRNVDPRQCERCVKRTQECYEGCH